MLYFAYGMNTNNNAMNDGSQRLGPAILHNFKWEMLQFANVFAKPNAKTIGILWDINDETLQYLDIREGYPDFYNRIQVDVEHNNQIKKAWVYSMSNRYRTELSNIRPSQYYVDCVTEGFAQDGIAISI